MGTVEESGLGTRRRAGASVGTDVRNFLDWPAFISLKIQRLNGSCSTLV